jgi:hypothetical protein
MWRLAALAWEEWTTKNVKVYIPADTKNLTATAKKEKE